MTALALYTFFTTIELLGRSYHHNYEFDKAIDKFEFYSNFLAENNWDDKRANNRRIRQAKYAKSLFENPVEENEYTLSGTVQVHL